MGCDKAVWLLTIAAVCGLLVQASGCALLGGGRDAASAFPASKAAFDQGLDLVFGKKCEAALERLRPIVQGPDPKDPYRDDAIFWTGYCYQEMGRTEEAMRTFMALIREYPRSRYAGPARDRLRKLRGHPQK